MSSTDLDVDLAAGEAPLSSSQGGSLVWEYKTMDSHVTSIVESDGVLYVAGCSDDGGLYALDSVTGSSLWQHSTRGQAENCVPTQPVVVDDVVYISSICRDCDRGLFGGVLVTLDVTALDAETGDMLWRHEKGALEGTRPVVSGGRVFLASPEGGVTALDATSGDPQWQHEPGERFISPRFDTPVVSGSTLYGAAADDLIYALDAATGDLVWRHEIAGGVTSAPVVDHGAVYITSSDGHLYALTSNTGELLWQYEMGGGTMVSPIVSGEVVYVVSEDDHVYALASGTGELLWRYKTGYSIATPLVVSGGALYVVSWEDRYLYALDASTGAFKWRYRTGFVRQRPVVSRGIVYFGSEGWPGLSRSGLYALDAATGVRYWQYDGVEAPVVSDGLVYVRTPWGPSAASVYALEAGVKEGAQTPVWQYEAGGIGSQAVSGGVISVRGWDGQLHTLDAVTGDLRWRYELDEPVVFPGVVSETVVCVVSGCFVYGFDADTGDLLWQFDTGCAEFEREAPPVLSDGVLYLASTWGSVYALNTNTGDLLWRFDADDTVRFSPVSSDGVVYFASLLYGYAVDAVTGDLIWRFDADELIWPSPVVSDGVAYFVSEFIHLNAVDVVSGDLLWRFDAEQNRYLSLPVVSDRTVIIAARNELSKTSVVYALDSGTGAVVWEEKTSSMVYDAPVVSGGVVFITTVDGQLYALDEDTADTRWRIDLAEEVSTSPVVSDGMVFILAWPGQVYSLDEFTGDFHWRYETAGPVYTTLVVSGGMVYVSGVLYLDALDAGLDE